VIRTTAPAAYPRVLIHRSLRRNKRKLPKAISTSRAGSPLLFGLAPRGVFRASFVAKRAVGSYPTVSPLPAESAFRDVLQVSLLDATVLDFTGGLFSVALSVNRNSHRGSPDVIRRVALYPETRNASRGAGFPTLRPETSVSGLSSRLP
jgi:hypothetical protein